MFCQECGKEVRATARYCNGCGTPVRQRFNAAGPAQSDAARQAGEPLSAPLNRESANEGSLIIPIAPDEMPRARRAESRTIFEPVTSASSALRPDGPTTARQTIESHTASAAASPALQSAPAKTFFTEVLPATVNRQHHRLVIVTALLLLAFVALVTLFYFAAKYA